MAVVDIFSVEGGVIGACAPMQRVESSLMVPRWHSLQYALIISVPFSTFIALEFAQFSIISVVAVVCVATLGVSNLSVMDTQCSLSI